MVLEKYSFGVGDRFEHQGKAQLQAIINAKTDGIDIVPVWNKSNREHSIIGTKPADTRAAADRAVKDMSWADPYYVDADHIQLGNVDGFLESSDFFTLDVADHIGERADAERVAEFINRYKKYCGSLLIEGIEEKLEITEQQLKAIAEKYLNAIIKAGELYRYIEKIKVMQRNFWWIKIVFNKQLMLLLQEQNL